MKELKAFLQKLEKGGTLTKWGEKIMKVVLAVVVVIVLIILAQIGMFVGMFNWLEGVIRTTTGLDAMLAKAIAFLFLALLFGTPLGGFAWSFLPGPRKDKKKKRFIFLTVLSILFFGAYFASRDVYFDPETGEPVKYYSVDANGEYKFSSSGGYDPKTGEELKPATSEMFKKIREANEAAYKQKLIKDAKIQEFKRIIRNERRLDSLSKADLQHRESEVAEAEFLQRQREEGERQTELARLKKELEKANAELERRTHAESTAKSSQEKQIVRKSTEESKPKELPTGYRIALNGNSGSLERLFIPFVIRPGSAWTLFTCQVSFENNSSFTFDLYNYDRVRLFEVPPGEKTSLPIESGPHFLKARELKEMLPFNIFEERNNLNVQIYDRLQN